MLKSHDVFSKNADDSRLFPSAIFAIFGGMSK